MLRASGVALAAVLSATAVCHADDATAAGNTASEQFEFEPLAGLMPDAFEPASAHSAQANLDAAAASIDQPYVFGLSGSRYLMLATGYGSDLKDDQFVCASAAFSYFIDDDISLDLGLGALYFDQDDTDDAFGINATLLLRWHFLRDKERKWSFYTDGGAGLLAVSEEVPKDGTNLNFTPQIGVGFSFDLNDHARFFTGVRWQHVSNANTSDENPGIDFLQIYAAVGFPF